MEVIDSLSVKHIIRRPLKLTEKTPLFLMIHGYGSHENDLFALARELPPNFFVISLRGFHSIGPNSFAWYNIQMSAEGISSDINQALISRDKIIGFIKEALVHYRLDEKNVWICGFSQGAILSYGIAFSKLQEVHKVIALSGFPHQQLLPENIDKDFSSLDFFISHGIHDEIIPVSWAKKGPELLEKHHICHTYKEYEEGHELNEDNYKDMLEWIANR